MNQTDKKIAIIGLGYVGLPLAVAFAEKFKVVGFDINEQRVQELNEGVDRTLEVDNAELLSLLKIENNEFTNYLLPTTNVDELKDCNIFINCGVSCVNFSLISINTPGIFSSVPLFNISLTVMPSMILQLILFCKHEYNS